MVKLPSARQARIGLLLLAAFHQLRVRTHVVHRDVLEAVHTEIWRILQLVDTLHAHAHEHVEYDGFAEPRDDQGGLDEAVGVGVERGVQEKPRPEVCARRGIEGASTRVGVELAGIRKRERRWRRCIVLAGNAPDLL
ncbi:hypothetical protein PC9H_004378 [Pleurotus ostreatus]|uniref:Uncharacterized protein n=1 Tax=Pleurotus ostreatus TaxID=5322 RepID=A0A8H7A471_PLEOS|nr:uncharacterized protein PC9H_004378 [Pleurotus ostreatus]KAF7437536.1 hypothetical protein PC9H_004378 [Pleurotus ostreatus]